MHTERTSKVPEEVAQMSMVSIFATMPCATKHAPIAS